MADQLYNKTTHTPIYPVINTTSIPNSAVEEDKINAGAVTTGKIADNAVTTAKINNGAITTAKVNDGAITTDKIADSSITTAKLGPLAVKTGTINTEAVTTAKIKDGAITTAKLANNAVTTGKCVFHVLEEYKLHELLLIAQEALGSLPTYGDFITWYKANSYPIFACRYEESTSIERTAVVSITTTRINIAYFDGSDWQNFDFLATDSVDLTAPIIDQIRFIL